MGPIEDKTSVIVLLRISDRFDIGDICLQVIAYTIQSVCFPNYNVCPNHDRAISDSKKLIVRDDSLVPYCHRIVHPCLYKGVVLMEAYCELSLDRYYG